MDKNQTSFLLMAAVICDVALEIMKIPVPQVVLILAGFAIRHIATVENAPPDPAKPPVDASAIVPAAAKVAALVLLVASLTGCSSAVLKSGCGHINGAEVTIPYVGGKANGNAYGCYMACVGSNCKAPDYNALAIVTAEYIKDAAKDNTLPVNGPGTVVFTPAISK